MSYHARDERTRGRMAAIAWIMIVAGIFILGVALAGCMPVNDPRQPTVVRLSDDLRALDAYPGVSWRFVAADAAKYWRDGVGAQVWPEDDFLAFNSQLPSQELWVVEGGALGGDDVAATYRWDDGRIHLNMDRVPPNYSLGWGVSVLLAHELGHAFGMQHLPPETGVMSSSGWEDPDHRGLSAADVEQFRARWGER